MKTEPTLRIQYLKGLRSAIKRGAHPSDGTWIEDVREQISAIALLDVRQEADRRFQHLAARRRFLNPNSASYSKEVTQGFDELIEYLQKNDITALPKNEN